MQYKFVLDRRCLYRDYVASMLGLINEHRTARGMRIDRGRRVTGRTPAPVPLSAPQIQHDMTCDRTGVAAVGNRRLAA